MLEHTQRCLVYPSLFKQNFRKNFYRYYLDDIVLQKANCVTRFKVCFPVRNQHREMYMEVQRAILQDPQACGQKSVIKLWKVFKPLSRTSGAETSNKLSGFLKDSKEELHGIIRNYTVSMETIRKFHFKMRVHSRSL